MGLIKSAVLVAVSSLVMYIISEYRVWLDLDRTLYTNYPGKCQTLLSEGGSEDFAEFDDDTILVSSGLNFFAKPGRIFALYTNGTVVKLPVVNTVNEEETLPGAHGISIWTDPQTGVKLDTWSDTHVVSIWTDPESGSSYLYVVIHGKNNQEGVAVFEIIKYPLTLRYIKTISDPEITGLMNDLVVVDKDTFYITQTVVARNWYVMALEIGLSLPTGKVLYYDGKKAWPVLTGITGTNGIALSLDKRTLYLSEFARKKIHSLQIKNDGSLKTNWVIPIGSGPDNVLVDSTTGDLWVGAFPYIYTVVDLLGLFGRYSRGGQVLRLRMTDGKVQDIEEVFYNNGSYVDSTSVAFYKKNKLFIGTVSSKLVMCDVHYMQ